MNHSHGYEMRLQSARLFRNAECEKNRAERVLRDSHIRKFEALQRALNAIEDLPELLATYEATGDHNHGNGSIPTGAPCPGGDCNVAKARRIIEAMKQPA